MKKKTVALLLLAALSLSLFAALAGCGDKTPATTPEPEEPTSHFAFAEKSLTLYVGDSTATVVTALTAGESVTSYTSNNTEVATISDDGVITALSVGNAIIKATTSKGNQSLMRVEVVSGDELPLPVLRLDTAELQLQATDTYRLTATALYKGEMQDAALEWSTSNDHVATVAGGTVRAVGVGQCTVTAAYTCEGQRATASALVTVRRGGVAVTTNYENRDFYVGDALVLKLYLYDNGQQVQPDTVSFRMETTRVGTLETEGDTTTLRLARKGEIRELTATFTYSGEEYTLVRSLYVYGDNFVTIRVNGQDDHRVTGRYGDRITLALDGTTDRAIKCWYVDGERITGNTFVMPDKAVLAEAKLVNQTEGDFTANFADSSMFSSNASYSFETGSFADAAGGVSTDGNYVRVDSLGSGKAALTYHFDKNVQVKRGDVLVVRFRIDSANAVFYLGTDSGTRWAIAMNAPGEAPYEQTVPLGTWQEMTFSLTDFAAEGEFLSSVSIGCTGVIYIDYITMRY